VFIAGSRNHQMGMAGVGQMKSYEDIVRQLLSQAGIRIDGNNPWDIRVHNKEFYRRALVHNTLGLGESYMDAWWSCDAIDQLFERLVKAELHLKAQIPSRFKFMMLADRCINRQTRARAMKVVKAHYDTESEIVLSFLDGYKQYSCAYFQETEDLHRAQVQKLDLICRKLHLSPSDHLLDIGSGYGGLARYAAENYGCKVTGITPSSEQIVYAREFCRGLEVNFFQSDYRDLRGTFSKIVSVGMFEHVGHRNYRKFMGVAHDCLQEDGLFLLHTIGGSTSVYTNDPWIEKYIFPNGMLPSIKQIAQAAEGLFVMEDVQNFGQHYDKTLMSWHKAFLQNWEAFSHRFDAKTFRKWTYYLLHLAGVFRGRKNQLWQAVFSKKGVPGGYPALRG
jgi:cyclopropane-fatty-acyl-phospholipid synthase